jgi:hypothetical protein
VKSKASKTSNAYFARKSDHAFDNQRHRGHQKDLFPFFSDLYLVYLKLSNLFDNVFFHSFNALKSTRLSVCVTSPF